MKYWPCLFAALSLICLRLLCISFDWPCCSDRSHCSGAVLTNQAELDLSCSTVWNSTTASQTDAYHFSLFILDLFGNLNYLRWVSTAKIFGSVCDRWSTAGFSRKKKKRLGGWVFSLLNYFAKPWGSSQFFLDSWSCKYKHGCLGRRQKCNTLV